MHPQIILTAQTLHLKKVKYIMLFFVNTSHTHKGRLGNKYRDLVLINENCMVDDTVYERPVFYFLYLLVHLGVMYIYSK